MAVFHQLIGVWYRPNDTLKSSLRSKRMMLRSTSALNPVAEGAGAPVPASAHAVSVTSAKNATRRKSRCQVQGELSFREAAPRAGLIRCREID